MTRSPVKVFITYRYNYKAGALPFQGVGVGKGRLKGCRQDVGYFFFFFKKLPIY